MRLGHDPLLYNCGLLLIDFYSIVLNSHGHVHPTDFEIGEIRGGA
jgi:hypothetical protein